MPDGNIRADLHGQRSNKSIPPPDREIPFDKEPVVVKKVQPKYPASMLSGGWKQPCIWKHLSMWTATCRSEKWKSPGNSHNIIINKHDEAAGQRTDGKAFQEAAYNAVKQWKFSPHRCRENLLPYGWPFHSVSSWTQKERSRKMKHSRAKMEKSVESIKTTIENILKGTDLEKAKKCVEQNAILVYNSKIENLYSVLNGEHKDIHLIEGKEAKCVNFNINTTDGGKSALIVWTSNFPREEQTCPFHPALKDWRKYMEDRSLARELVEESMNIAVRSFAPVYRVVLLTAMDWSPTLFMYFRFACLWRSTEWTIDSAFRRRCRADTKDNTVNKYFLKYFCRDHRDPLKYPDDERQKDEKGSINNANDNKFQCLK